MIRVVAARRWASDRAAAQDLVALAQGERILAGDRRLRRRGAGRSEGQESGQRDRGSRRDAGRSLSLSRSRGWSPCCCRCCGKTFGLTSTSLLLTVFLVDTPYVTTAFGLSAFTGEPENNTPLTERLSIAFPFSLFFLAIASAFIGGYPISAEKAERTDRFLDYLPPTRLAGGDQQVLIALGSVAVGLDRAGDRLFHRACVRRWRAADDGWGEVLIVYHAISASLILFGLAWLASLYVRSSTLCGLAAIIGWIAVLTIVRKIVLRLSSRPLRRRPHGRLSAVDRGGDRRDVLVRRRWSVFAEAGGLRGGQALQHSFWSL